MPFVNVTSTEKSQQTPMSINYQKTSAKLSSSSPGYSYLFCVTNQKVNRFSSNTFLYFFIHLFAESVEVTKVRVHGKNVNKE